jgi:hypothetical protein
MSQHKNFHSFVPRQQCWTNSNRKRFFKKQIVNTQQSTGTVNEFSGMQYDLVLWVHFSATNSNCI